MDVVDSSRPITTADQEASVLAVLQDPMGPVEPMTRARLLRHGIVVAALLLIVALPVSANCEPEPITPDTPTGIRGCVVYGEGTASMWGGPGVARNDCVYPWDDCQPIAIQSLETGVTIVVTPTMFGDLYTGTPDERIVDLDPAAIAALGLDPSRGLWPVTVKPFRESIGLPNTSTEAP